jgi:hypothetical protein
MGWELRKKPLPGERPVPKLSKLAKLPKLPRPPKLPQTRTPKPAPAPPGYEYVWKNE